ncbi:MAG: hypothetical protein ABUT39_13535 [Acidobacteriota bacterium]
MALKTLRSASADGQFTRLTIDTRRGSFNKLEVVKDGQTTPLYTVPVAPAKAGLFAIRFHELHPDLPPEQQQAWPIVEYRLRGQLAANPEEPADETAKLRIRYHISPQVLQGTGTFSPIRVDLLFRVGATAADNGWIDIDLDFDYPPEVVNQSQPGRVWEMQIDCPRVSFPLDKKMLFLDPDGRLELLSKAADRVPFLSEGELASRHVASLQFLGVYETGVNPSNETRHVQGVVFAGTDELGHRKEVFVNPPADNAAEVGCGLVNPIHLQGGKFVRPAKYVLSKGDGLGFGGAGMTWRVRAFHIGNVFANAAVDWFDVADLYRDWVRTRTKTLFRRALQRELTGPVDTMNPWTIVQNYGLDSASEPSRDLKLARWLEIHPMRVPSRAGDLGQPDVAGNVNESLFDILVRVYSLFAPQTGFLLEAQIWGFEMGGFYRFLGAFPPVCDTVGAPAKHATTLASLLAKKIVPLATTDPLNPNFDRKRYGAHVRRQGDLVVEAIAQPFPQRIVDLLRGKVNTDGRRFLLESGYDKADILRNCAQRLPQGGEPVEDPDLNPFYGRQSRGLCPLNPLINLYLIDWLRDGLFRYGFRLIEFMKVHPAQHYCYNAGHVHPSAPRNEYDNVIGPGVWYIQRLSRMMRSASDMGRGLNPSFALSHEFCCAEPLVPFFEDYYEHYSSAVRVYGDGRPLEGRFHPEDGDTRSLELHQSTAEQDDDLLGRRVPVFQYVYSQQITAKMSILEDDTLNHPGYRETRTAPVAANPMLAAGLDTTAIPGFRDWHRQAQEYCAPYTTSEIGVAPDYEIDARPDGTHHFAYRRCLQDVINLKSRIFRFGMAGVWGERILLPADWIEKPFEYNQPAIEMAVRAAHFQMRFHDYLRRGGFMLGPGQILKGNKAVSAWRITWRTFEDAPDVRKRLGSAKLIYDRRSRGTDPDGQFAVKITTDKIQHMVWQKRTAQEIRNLYVFANVGNAPETVRFRCARGLESRASWRRAVYTFAGGDPGSPPASPLPTSKADTVDVPPRTVVAVEIFP